MQRDYDSTIARMAGNIAAGLLASPHFTYASFDDINERIAKDSVGIARAIVAETRNTEPVPAPVPAPVRAILPHTYQSIGIGVCYTCHKTRKEHM